jgi:hypothetical protein
MVKRRRLRGGEARGVVCAQWREKEVVASIFEVLVVP